MRSQRQYSRRGYAPLTVSCVLSCSTPLSPMTQLFRDGEYEPDRTLTPCGLRPEVSSSASDGSWANKDTRALIAQMKWFVDGTDITTLAAWNGHYEIVQTGTDKGTLLIKRNFPDGERHAFYFSCVLPDTRTGQNIAMRSDDAVLVTQSVAGDTWVLESGVGSILPYDITKDLLYLYDYLHSHGIDTQLTPTTAKDGNEYLRTVPIVIRKGKDTVTKDVTVRLYRTDLATRKELTVGEDELVALSPTALTIDLRTVPQGATYYAEVTEGDRTVARKTLFSVSRRVQAVTAQPTNGGDLLEGQTERWDKAVVRLRDKNLDSPELYLNMKWYADTAFETEHFLGMGSRVDYSLDDLVIGTSPSDAWAELYIDYDYKQPHSQLTDADGNVLTGADGNELIFN